MHLFFTADISSTVVLTAATSENQPGRWDQVDILHTNDSTT